MKVVKIGLIGCGAVTIKAHIPALMNDPLAKISSYCFTITAVCGLDEANIAYIRAILPNVAIYEDYEKLLSDSDCEAVVIATGEHLHPRITLEALKLNKFVLCEKPFAKSSEEIMSFMDSIDDIEKDRLQIAFNKRFYPNYLRYLRLREFSKIGPPILGTFHFFTRQGAKPGWVGILSNLIHYCDLICSVFGEISELHAVRSLVNDPDSGGVSISVSMRSSLGSAVSLVFTSSASWRYPWHEEWQLLDIEGNRMVCRNSTESFLQQSGGETLYEQASNSIFWLPDAHGYKTQLKAFYDLVTGEADKPVVDIDSALRAHLLFDQIKAKFI